MGWCDRGTWLYPFPGFDLHAQARARGWPRRLEKFRGQLSEPEPTVRRIKEIRSKDQGQRAKRKEREIPNPNNQPITSNQRPATSHQFTPHVSRITNGAASNDST